MDGFYVSLIFLGIIIVLFSLTFIFFDKKKSFGFMKSYDAKRQELLEIINDAELMIEELNKFSDYIVNQMDLKNEELSRNLADAENRLDIICQRASGDSIVENKSVQKVTKANGMKLNPEPEMIQSERIKAEAASASSGVMSTAAVSEYSKQSDNISVGTVKRAEKVIPMKNKYSEVIRLSNEGIENTDIAQKLNMGKGEVELILGIRK